MPPERRGWGGGQPPPPTNFINDAELVKITCFVGQIFSIISLKLCIDCPNLVKFDQLDQLNDQLPKKNVKKHQFKP